MTKLTTTDHSRASAGLTYVYPVMSRRSGGLSIGINLNPNNACNWRCIYCQVPDLVRGKAPPIDLDLLRTELRGLLLDALDGRFFDAFEVPEAQRVIRDIAISGNGEPTSAAEFPQLVDLIGEICAEFSLGPDIKRVLITNGSQVGKPEILQALENWAQLGGEVWFKIDRATESGREAVNSVRVSTETVLKHLENCARACPTWIQTCWFAIDGQAPDDSESSAYLELLNDLKRRKVPLEGVLLYGLARPSMQAEAARLAAVPETCLDDLGHKLRQLGLQVKISR